MGGPGGERISHGGYRKKAMRERGSFADGKFRMWEEMMEWKRKEETDRKGNRDMRRDREVL